MQTSYSENPAVAVPGMLADSSNRRVVSAIVEQASSPAGIEPGLVVVKGSSGFNPLQVRVPLAPVAVDTDAIKLSIATVGAPVTYSGADFNGVVGEGNFDPPQYGTATFSAHADVNAGTLTWVYENGEGEQVTDVLTIADGPSGQTLRTTQPLARSISTTISTMGGTGGAVMFGVAADGGLNDQETVGIAVHDDTLGGDDIHDHETDIPVLRNGVIWCTIEDAFVYGDPVYVRHVATGGEKRGAIRTAPDGTDCYLLEGARIISEGGAGDLGMVEINLPY